jgi:hypothetical protein
MTDGGINRWRSAGPVLCSHIYLIALICLLILSYAKYGNTIPSCATLYTRMLMFFPLELFFFFCVSKDCVVS